MKRIEKKAANTTAKCPECGGKYIKATKYCPSCKKKVKESKNDVDYRGFTIRYNPMWKAYSISPFHPEGGASDTFSSVEDAMDFIDGAGQDFNPRWLDENQNDSIQDIIKYVEQEHYIFSSLNDPRIPAVERYLEENNIPYMTTSQLGNDWVIAGKNSHFYRRFFGENIIELPEDVTIDMGDREVILEKGDRVEVVNKVEENRIADNIYTEVSALVRESLEEGRSAGVVSSWLTLYVAGAITDTVQNYENDYESAPSGYADDIKSGISKQILRY